MSFAAATLEDRIRERAYHLWEANGRPPGRDQEFWHQACELVAGGDDEPQSAARQRRPAKRAQPAAQSRKRNGKSAAAS
jgi:hypothetical protein